VYFSLCVNNDCAARLRLDVGAVLSGSAAVLADTDNRLCVFLQVQNLIRGGGFSGKKFFKIFESLLCEQNNPEVHF
jgi:hypothetical protein